MNKAEIRDRLGSNPKAQLEVMRNIQHFAVANLRKINSNGAEYTQN
jgi:hypothetical protein